MLVDGRRVWVTLHADGTARSETVSKTRPEFNALAIELALLILLVLVMVIAIFIFRRAYPSGEKIH